MRKYFTETDLGVVLVVDGENAMQRWDALTSSPELAGLAPPGSAPTIGVSSPGAGAIVGTYYAYVRFVDRLGYVSNLSPISAVYTPSLAGGNVTGATFAAPIQITSAGHGLTTGAIVQVINVGGNTAANNTWTVTVIDADNFSLDGSSGNSDYIGAGTWTSGVDTLQFTGVATTADPKVVRRQILRNTDGQTDTFYVDVDTTDLVSTTFNSTQVDDILAAGEAVPILDDNGLPLANANGVPPTQFTCLCPHLTRIFGSGQRDISDGSCIVTNGSATVVGVGTDWKIGLQGRYLNVKDATQTYQIMTVSESAQTITLTANYTDSTEKFAEYAISPAPAQRRLVYYTPAGLPESWPATYALAIQEDGDDITGLMARGSFLYILEKRHIYKLTFQNDPATDGALFLAANRGSVNERSWAIVDNDAYMLDEYGVWKFDANGQVSSLSTDIQEIFRPNSLYHFHVNWKAIDNFFCVVSRPQETVRWFVCLEGDDLPRHSLAYNYRLQRWWIEKWPFKVGAGVAAHIDNVPYTILCGENNKTFCIWFGTTDVAQPDAGTIRGNVTDWTATNITDALANFSVSGIGSAINSPATVVYGNGKSQERRVVDATATSLTLDYPLTVSLNTQSDPFPSVYQVGGINWKWRSTWMRLGQADSMVERSIEILYETSTNVGTFDFLLNQDFQGAEVQKDSVASDQGGGVETIDGYPERIVDLTKKSGVVQVRMPRTREGFADGTRYNQIEFSGSTNQDVVAIYEIIISGMGSIAIVGAQQS